MSGSPVAPPDERRDDDAVDEIVRQGPIGAAIVALIATTCVVAMWFAFYAFVFIPRGTAP